MADEFTRLRRKMVDEQICPRGVSDSRVLAAMESVPRQRFVPEAERGHSYDDAPLAIGFGQTISQPYIVAYMTELLELGGEEKVLEIGTGSGYQTAVLAETASQVYTVEIIEELSCQAQQLLAEQLGYRNVHFRIGRGQEGWLECSPYDRVLVTAAASHFSDSLMDQLAEGGIAVAPLTWPGMAFQRLVRFRKTAGRIRPEELIGVSFVPLV